MIALVEFVAEVGFFAFAALAYPVVYTRREDRRRKEAHTS